MARGSSLPADLPAGVRRGEVRYALSLALVTNVDERTGVRLPADPGACPVLGPGQRVEMVDAILETAPDGSPVLVVAQGLIHRLRGLQAANLARSCALCGCTDDVACPGGCSWVTAELCSYCAPIALVPT